MRNRTSDLRVPRSPSYLWLSGRASERGIRSAGGASFVRSIIERSKAKTMYSGITFVRRSLKMALSFFTLSL